MLGHLAALLLRERRVWFCLGRMKSVYFRRGEEEEEEEGEEGISGGRWMMRSCLS